MSSGAAKTIIPVVAGAAAGIATGNPAVGMAVYSGTQGLTSQMGVRAPGQAGQIQQAQQVANGKAGPMALGDNPFLEGQQSPQYQMQDVGNAAADASKTDTPTTGGDKSSYAGMAAQAMKAYGEMQNAALQDDAIKAQMANQLRSEIVRPSVSAHLGGLNGPNPVGGGFRFYG
jgi:hypothetical protein